MRGYARDEVFTEEHLAARSAACAFVLKVEERKPRIRCHELARAVAYALEDMIAVGCWEVADGSYGLVEHSWLYACATRTVILDVYRPGCEPMVQLIDCACSFSPFNSYIEKDRRSDIDLNLVSELASEMLRGLVSRSNPILLTGKDS